MGASRAEKQMKQDSPRLFSVGHSNHDLVQFLHLLQQAGITAVADVRSSPYSQRLPHFNRPELERALGLHGIAYVFLGDLLGGRPESENLYDEEGRVDYENVRATEFFQRGLDRLIQGMERHTIAMLCAEEDPLDCHRGLMITPALVERGLAPLHLRRGGSIETTAQMVERLFAETGVGVGVVDGLFAEMLSDEERRQYLAEAYRNRAQLRAFRTRDETNESDNV